MSNFETVGQINLQPGDSMPWDFYFPPAASVTQKGAIPTGTNIASVIVTAFNSEGDSATAELIDGVPTVVDNVVTVVLKYPATTGDGRYKVTFACTLDTGSTRQFDFQRVFGKTV